MEDELCGPVSLQERLYSLGRGLRPLHDKPSQGLPALWGKLMRTGYRFSNIRGGPEPRLDKVKGGGVVGMWGSPTQDTRPLAHLALRQYKQSRPSFIRGFVSFRFALLWGRPKSTPGI